MRAPTFSVDNIRQMVNWLNTIFQAGLTLENNFSGQIINVSLTGGTELKIPHRLKAVPKYRIILRQSANAVVYDGSDWNDNFITLNSASDNDVTILLMRG